jgi:hypothetical protein
MSKPLFVLMALVLPVLGVSQGFEIDTLQWSGPIENRINIVFLSDGYQEDELPFFIEDAVKVGQHFFNESPFKEYQSYFNIVAIKVPSNVSGAARDPDELIDNYFGSTYNYAGIDRLLVATKSSRAQDILFDQFPLFDQAVLIVNDPKYGGSGGWLATTSIDINAPEIALHEIGHSFADLADEYWVGDQYAAEKPNMTKTTDPTLIKWRKWLEFMKTGIFPHTGDPSWVKPHQNCKMQVLNPPFCPVCKQQITRSILNRISPLIAEMPETSTLAITSDTLLFSVDLLKPNPNTLQVSWSMDNEFQHRDSASFKLIGEALAPGPYVINALIQDTTSYIRNDTWDKAITFSSFWNLEKNDVTPLYNMPLKAEIEIYPNPATEMIQVALKTAVTADWNVELVDLSGKLFYSRSLSGNHTISIPLTHIPSGLYEVKISSPHDWIAKKIVRK